MHPAGHVHIRNLEARDEASWRELWAGYLRFYEHDAPAEVTAHTWQRLITRSDAMFALVAERDRQLVGFVMCVLHASSWKREPSCYLEDLFVAEAARGHGVGRALIADVVQRGRAAGWSRVYWHTHQDNQTARRLYDSFASADAFVRYRIPLD